MPVARALQSCRRGRSARALVLCALSGCLGSLGSFGCADPVEPAPLRVPTPDPAPPTPPVVEPVTVSVEPFVCELPELRGRMGPFYTVPLHGGAVDSPFLAGAAAAAGDVDGDGDIDVVLGGTSGPWLFRAPDWAPERLGDVEGIAGMGIVDLDGDGDLDLYLGRYEATDAVLLNDGQGAFRNASDQLVGNRVSNSVAVSFADIDGDGDLDGFVGSNGHALVHDLELTIADFPEPEPALLWINTGHELLESGLELPERVHTGFTLAGGLHDMDADGAIDLYLVNDFGTEHGGNLWCRGDGAGGFVDDEAVESSGLNVAVAGMGLGIGDLNGDGFDDVAIPHWGGVRVLETAVSGGQPVWFDHTIQRLPQPFGANNIAWGAELADFDADGRLDLYVHFGYADFGVRWPNPALQRDRLFLSGEPSEPFREVAGPWGLASTDSHRGSVVADMNGDGWLDVLRPSLTGESVLLLSRCGEGGGAVVSLEMPGENPFAIGARVRLVTETADQLRTVRSGGTNYGTSGPPDAHFGVGDATQATVEVVWPDGEVTVHEGLDVPAHLRIRRTQ
ncbi:MAG: CRTAC1 family protein [Myxococcota bacterium]